MIRTVNIYEAKTQLSRLVDRAVAGEDVVIARAGKPLVRLTPVQPAAEVAAPRRVAGQLKGLGMTDSVVFDPSLRAASPDRPLVRRRPPPELRGLPVPEDMLAPMSDEELAEWE